MHHKKKRQQTSLEHHKSCIILSLAIIIKATAKVMQLINFGQFTLIEKLQPTKTFPLYHHL